MNAPPAIAARPRDECGCVASALSLLASMAVYVPYAAWFTPANESVQHAVPMGIGIAFCAALIGKAAAIVWSHWRYRKRMAR